MGDDGGKFAKAAKELKEETRVTLREIAATCNSSESMVSRYINGQSEPPPDIADAIMQMLRAEKAAQDERAMRNNTTLAQLEESQNHLEEAYKQRIAGLLKHLEYERKQKRIFSIALLATLFGVIVFLLVDIFNGGLGWVRY